MEEEVDELSDTEEIWPLVSRLFSYESLFQHQIRSYDDLVEESIQKLIDETNEILIEVGAQRNIRIKLERFCIEKLVASRVDDDGRRRVYPSEARLRNLTYTAPLFVNVTFRKEFDDEEVTSADIRICDLPVMVKSSVCSLKLNLKEDKELNELGECPTDPGGYFIVNGVERAFIAQERLCYNQVMVFKQKKQSELEYVAEIRCRGDENRPASTLYLRISRRQPGSHAQYISVKLPYIRLPIPLVVLFRALGVISDRDIIELIGCDTDMKKLLEHSLKQAPAIRTKQAALEYIGERVAKDDTPKDQWIQYASDFLQNELLPHVGLNMRKKACNFGYIAHRLLACTVGRINEDDKDHFGNRRLDLAGCILTDLLRKELRKVSYEVKKTVQKLVEKGKVVTLDSAMANVAKKMTSSLIFSFSTGNFGLLNAEGEAVLPVINRLSYISTLSQLRRSYTPLAYKGTVLARHLHNTQWGKMCPVETPEGQACGLVKNLSLMVRISVGSAAGPILDILKSHDMQSLEEISNFEELSKFTKIFVNGCWIGIHEKPDELEKTLRDKKRQEIVNGIDIGVVRDRHRRELWINTDAGRCCRPLLTVHNLRLLIKKEHIDAIKQQPSVWEDVLGEGLIDYIDSNEEEKALISVSINELNKARFNPEEKYSNSYTHCEIHPSLILGICASIIPFPDHNHPLRNTSAANMSKQAVGIYATNYLCRMDTAACLLDYPQKPLVTTKSMEHLCLNQLPAGNNAVVAICSYAGYNEKDAIIMNQSSIDRGFLRSRSYHTYRDSSRRRGTLVHQHFGIPVRRKARDFGSCSYDALDIDGFPSPGEPINGGDIVIGKTSHIHSEVYDHSTRASPGGRHRVDQVMLSTDHDGYTLAKVKTRSVRIPSVGDKFSTRHGQKAVVGMTFQQEDMPWTAPGITPDVIINPHSLPQRMTINLLMEIIFGKSAACRANVRDATPFTPVTVDDLKRCLHGCGSQWEGREKMYSGQTGKALSNESITMGLVYYQRLRHMVEDKIQSRARGPVESLTRQPTKGRTRDGGLRVGEMERDCLISHGAALSLKERLFQVSDPYMAHVCERCGFIAIAYLNQRQFYCKVCESNTSIVQVHIPYACKLLFQELMAMGIAPRMQTKM